MQLFNNCVTCGVGSLLGNSCVISAKRANSCPQSESKTCQGHSREFLPIDQVVTAWAHAHANRSIAFINAKVHPFKTISSFRCTAIIRGVRYSARHGCPSHL